MDYENYICALVAALTILVLGYMNPKIFQDKGPDGKPNGCMSYLWLALLVFIAVVVIQFLWGMSEGGSSFLRI